VSSSLRDRTLPSQLSRQGARVHLQGRRRTDTPILGARQQAMAEAMSLASRASLVEFCVRNGLSHSTRESRADLVCKVVLFITNGSGSSSGSR
jgi:hypothetical protein